MQSPATTVAEYLASLPADRRAALEAVRKVILKNLDRDYTECMQYGMIGYAVPHSVFPAGYHCDPKVALPFAGLASQKNYMSLYLMCVYGSPEHEAWFRSAWAKAGKKLDMGKGCVRFKKLEDVPLDVVGEAIKRVPASKFIARYEATLAAMGKAPGAPKGKPAAAKGKPTAAKGKPTAVKSKPTAVKSKPTAVKSKPTAASTPARRRKA